MSNSHNTKKQRPAKVRKPVNRTATRKPTQCSFSDSRELEVKSPLDAESRQNMAVFEWWAFDEETLEKLESLGIKNQEAYIEVIVGLEFDSGQLFIEWAEGIGIGLVRTPKDLTDFMLVEVQSLLRAINLYNAMTGNDKLEEVRVATRHSKISGALRYRQLSTGSKYYFSPYKIGTDEYIVWLRKCSRKFVDSWDLESMSV